MSTALSVSGRLSETDVKRATRANRGVTFGPTTVYYAGVTAPVISASMSVLVRSTAARAGFPPYWQWLTAALIAALAGIAWYLIFMRLSTRRSPGRDGELAHETQIDLDADGLRLRRSGIDTRIAWANIVGLQRHRNVSVVQVRGADMIIVPDAWFSGGESVRQAFLDEIEQRIGAHGT